MTCVEVSYDYGMAPDDAVLRGMESIREVYGIRRLRVDDAAHRLTVEYDATRLNQATVSNLLRRTGLDLKQ